MEAIAIIVATITFFADLVTIGLFTRDLLEDTLDLKRVFVYVLLILLIFSFAIGLWVSVDADTDFLVFFGFLYVFFGGVIFAIVSYKFLMQFDYSGREYATYVVLIILITGLGVGILAISDVLYDEGVAYLSLPFIFVALEQIIFWIKIISSGEYKFDDNGIMAGNIFLFVIAGALVMLFLGFAYW